MQLLANDYPFVMALDQFFGVPSIFGWTICQLVQVGILLEIRVWIKTQPLKPWNVAREFRRRLKVALDKAGILIPMPQQEVWFNNTLPITPVQDGQGVYLQKVHLYYNKSGI